MLVILGGGFGIFELTYKRRKSPRGALPWLLVIFAIDAAVTVLAFLFLQTALAKGFLDPKARYAVALVWSTFLLRMQFEFLVPNGQHARDFFRVLPASREFLAERVSIAATSYRLRWLEERVVPGVRQRGLRQFAERSAAFLKQLDLIDETERQDLSDQVRNIENDTRSSIDKRITTIAELLIANHGLSTVKQFALTWRQARLRRRG